MLPKTTDFFARLLWAPEDETGAQGDGDKTTEETPSSLLDGEKTEEKEEPKSLLDDDSVEEKEGEETEEPLVEFNKDEVIKELGEEFQVDDEERLNAFFDLLGKERNPNTIATEALKMLSDYQAGWMDNVAKQWNDTQAEWQKAAREDPDIGGANFDKTTAAAKEVAMKYGGENFLGLLRLTGAGNHREMIAFLAAVAKDLPKEGKIVSGDPSSGMRPSQADRLFGTKE